MLVGLGVSNGQTRGVEARGEELGDRDERLLPCYDVVGPEEVRPWLAQEAAEAVALSHKADGEDLPPGLDSVFPHDCADGDVGPHEICLEGRFETGEGRIGSCIEQREGVGPSYDDYVTLVHGLARSYLEYPGRLRRAGNNGLPNGLQFRRAAEDELKEPGH